MKTNTFISILISVISFSCGSNNEPQRALPELPKEMSTDPNNAKNSLDVTGTYKGILPCADCDGIETTITLNPDETYTQKSKYLGKDEKVFEELGDYTWQVDGNTLSLEGLDSAPVLYFVSQNKLTQLDENGEKIKGKHEKDYVLNK